MEARGYGSRLSSARTDRDTKERPMNESKNIQIIKDAYAAFNPDSDTRADGRLSIDQRRDRLTRLFDAFASLLDRANFEQLSREQLLAARQRRNPKR